MSGRRRVAVVTGGGGGIGAGIAEELGRDGWFVVTVDPLVTLDGSEPLPEPEETTAGRIVAAGGSARASSVSVTDREAVRSLFEELADEHGGLDAVVNVAGITRQTYFGKGTEQDWLAVLGVHLDGYLNVLDAALPLMAAAGYGRVLGVTSGSGWRDADAGAYSCAKRAVAALTWQLGRVAPPGVTVNAMSPIAATRMMASALERARKAGQSGGGGISFLSVADPEDLGPFGAYLVGEEFGWCSGRVLFAGGPEVAVIDEPRLIEAVRTGGAASLARVLDEVIPTAFVKAETRQASAGGGNPRFGPIFDQPADGEVASSGIRTCVVVSDRPLLESSLVTALESRSVRCHRVDPVRGFDAAATALDSAAEAGGPIDAVVVAVAGRPAAGRASVGWEGVLAEHRDLVEQLHADAGWARATADHTARTGRPVRLVTLTDAVTSGGRSRAQAAVQHARGGHGCHRGAGDRLRRRPRGSGRGGRHGRGGARRPPARTSRGGCTGRSGAGGRRRVDRTPQPPPAHRQHHLRRPGTPRVARRHAPRDRGCRGGHGGGGGPMTDRPTRVVDAHVHIWDPARTDWYPYLSHPQAPPTAVASQMFRRFDVGTYRAESVGWNVEKFVNVAAATGRHSVEETIELDASARAGDGPDAIIGGIPPTDTVAEAVELLDRQMAAPRFRGVRPMGRHEGPLPPAGVLHALQERSLLFELMSHPDQLRVAADGLAGFDDLVVVVEHTGWPRSDADEERALWRDGLDALADVGANVVCKLSGLAMPLESMDAGAFAPWLERAIEAFGVDRCMFASNFPVDSMYGTFDELYEVFAAVTAGLDGESRDRLFATNAERVYRC